MRVRSAALATVMLLCQGCLAQTKAVPLKVGDLAPPLNITRVLQAPPDTVLTWHALRGKVVVIEFWATWCGPCLGAIPHLNALATKVKDRPVEFISITEPPELHVRTFLKSNPVLGWIALDPTASIAKSFGVKGIPQTLVIDRRGRIAAITGPERLTEAALDATLAGKPVKLPSEATLRGIGATPAAMQNVLVDVLIRANVPRDLGTKRYSNGDAGMSLKGMVATFYDTTLSRIVWPTPAPDLNMNFEYRIAIPQGQSGQYFNFAQAALAAALGLRAHWETREMSVLILEGPAGKPGPTLTPAIKPGALGSCGPGKITAHGITADGIAGAIESWSNKIVVNETALRGLYNVALTWSPGNPVSLLSAIQKQLGLKLVSAKRRIKVLVIDHINLPKGS